MKQGYKLLIWVVICAGIVAALACGVLDEASLQVRELRNTYFPDFHYHYDDYIIYIPLVVMFGMALAGVKCYSGWKRMLIRAIFSYALMLIIVNCLKNFMGVLRPDGSDYLSFPSEHTAAAFTASTLLYKEYGYKVKWTAIFIYLPAVATGITRMLNNRHWLSDVLAGALIAITCVLIVYYYAEQLRSKKKRDAA